MPTNNKCSVTTKLASFAIVTASIVFCANSQLPTSDRQAIEKIRGEQIPVVAIPVDRSALSQQLLPGHSDLVSSNPLERSGDLTDLHSHSNLTESNKLGTAAGPSTYERKLEDQRAWGSQPRPATLASSYKQRIESSEKSVVAGSESPIVPGIDDPHRWYESPKIELAIDIDGQLIAPLLTDDSMEMSDLPALPVVEAQPMIARQESELDRLLSPPTARIARVLNSERY